VGSKNSASTTKRFVDILAGARGAGLVKLNPMGKLPILTDGDRSSPRTRRSRSLADHWPGELSPARRSGAWHLRWSLFAPSVMSPPRSRRWAAKLSSQAGWEYDAVLASIGAAIGGHSYSAIASRWQTIFGGTLGYMLRVAKSLSRAPHRRVRRSPDERAESRPARATTRSSPKRGLGR
jgi:glutathione S-transferase